LHNGLSGVPLQLPILQNDYYTGMKQDQTRPGWLIRGVL